MQGMMGLGEGFATCRQVGQDVDLLGWYMELNCSWQGYLVKLDLFLLG